MMKFNALAKHYTAKQFSAVTLELMKTAVVWDDLNVSEYIKYSVTVHAGKLEDIVSISTFRDDNVNCSRFRNIPGSICQECYVSDYSYRSSLTKKLQKDSWFFSNIEITPEAVPVLPYLFIRFESFGDLINTLHFKNYCTIATVNSHANTALWTKFPFIIKKALKDYGNIKPGNMQIVYSWLFKNAVQRETETETVYLDETAFREYTGKHFPFIDKVFIVYDYEFAANHEITINCERKCNRCKNSCYLNTGDFYIREVEKHSAKKAEKAGKEALI